MIAGIGVDTVDIERFERQLARTPRLLDRLFAPSERELALSSLAARFAAKEALVKALGGSGELGYQDLIVERDRERAPGFVSTPALAAELAVRGADRAHLSLTHDGGFATAFVIVETVSGRVDDGGAAGGIARAEDSESR